jgi:hypothetical protein
LSVGLIEALLPQWQFEEHHTRQVQGLSADQLFDAIVPGLRHQDALTRTAIAFRELPARALGRHMGPPMGFDMFTELKRDAPREIVFGLVGRFWRLSYGLERFEGASGFEALAHEPRLVLNVCVEPAAHGAQLSTCTRVYCPSPALLRAFTPYWYLIRPVSGLIRQRLLKQIEETARP